MIKVVIIQGEVCIGILFFHDVRQDQAQKFIEEVLRKADAAGWRVGYMHQDGPKFATVHDTDNLIDLLFE